MILLILRTALKPASSCVVSYYKYGKLIKQHKIHISTRQEPITYGNTHTNTKIMLNDHVNLVLWTRSTATLTEMRGNPTNWKPNS
jgi:hypothetical protein